MNPQDDIKEILSSDEIQKYIKQKIKNKINNTINDTLSSEIHKMVTEIVNLQAADMVSEILNAPIVIRDGWSPTRRYDKFEDMFKEELRSRLTKYDISSMAERSVKNVVESNLKDHINTLSKSLLKISKEAEDGSN